MNNRDSYIIIRFNITFFDKSYPQKLSTIKRLKTLIKESYTLSYPHFPQSLHKILGKTLKKSKPKICFVKNS